MKEDADLATHVGPRSEMAYSSVEHLLQDIEGTGSDQLDLEPKLEFGGSSIFSPLSPKMKSGEDGVMKREEIDAPAASGSGSASPVKKPTLSRRRTQPEPSAPILIQDLPVAEDDALQTFTELKENDFLAKKLGRSNQQEEMMVCDCTFDDDTDEPEDACGMHSNCINRMTQVECLKGQCQTRGHCQNQRFSRRQYANIDIVQTEKKGFGIRTQKDLLADTFIYEYIGEVIPETIFRKRIKDYADEGIRHFYFMMLQKEEYIDATKKGGKARFLNHSCNPNCYVAKWVVGKRMRLGIFAKRDIIEGEELTFNYNVDRYGYDAQACYCGEPNCSGFIGGNTQTDLSAMDDLYLDALGVSEEIAALGLKGNKRKKARKLDEDFKPILKPMQSIDVPKVMAALRQATANHMMLVKLLQRVQMTEDDATLREITRMHGFSMMWNILTEFAHDPEIVILALESMQVWKVGNRVKIEDSKIEEPVRSCLESPDERISGAAKSLLAYWKDRPTVFRIPRKVHVPDTADDEIHGEGLDTTLVYDKPRYPSNIVETPKQSAFVPAPIVRAVSTPRPKPSVALSASAASTPVNSNPFFDKNRLEAILAQAQANQEAAAQEAAAAAEAIALERHKLIASPKRKADIEIGIRPRKRSKFSNEEKKEKQLMKLVGEFVVKTMSKYQYMMERETFKRHAKDCTQVLVDKEKRGKSYQEGKLEKLTDEKKAKLKTFIKEYAHKILKKLKDRGKLLNDGGPSGRHASGASTDREARDSTSQTAAQDDQLVTEMFGHDDMDDDEDNHSDDQEISTRSRDLLSLEESVMSTPPIKSPLNFTDATLDTARIVSNQTPPSPDTPPFEEYERLSKVAR